MLKLNGAKVEQKFAELQSQYDSVMNKAKNIVSNIPAISDDAKENITAQLVNEYGKGIADKLEFVKSFFDEVAE